jgi:ABC-type dipeptide/oligopeptide/nickel transport system permease component
MDQLSQNLPGIVALAMIVGIFAFAGIRIGLQFVIRRIAGIIFVLLGVTFITFILGYFAPGSAILSQLGGHAKPELIQQLIHEYGLDAPWYQQYATFLNGLLHFNLGYSYIERSQSVWAILERYVPISAQLGVTATVLAILTGVPLGIYAAVRSNTRYDTVVQTTSLVFYALPTFVLIPLYQIANIWLHSNNLPSFSVSGWDTWDAKVGPILIFGAGIFAFFLRITRASMLEVLRQDYVRTARAKGLTERRVIWLHAFRNALVNLLTAIGPALAFAVAGVFIVELLFNIPGIGVQTLTSIEQRDYPVVQGTVILLAVLIAMANLATDIAYGFVDPRIRTQ